MKRVFIVFAVVLLIFAEGLAQEKDEGEAYGDFQFNSLVWGSDWMSVEDSGDFTCDAIIRENGTGMIAQFENADYLGIPVSAALVFDTNGISDLPGLVSVLIRYEETDENELIGRLEEIYGIRNEYYTDPNGVMISITPAGWTSEKTIEASLSEDEKMYLMDLVKEYDLSRTEALLRSPLVTVKVNDDMNLIEFNGNHAACVKFVKSAFMKEVNKTNK